MDDNIKEKETSPKVKQDNEQDNINKSSSSDILIDKENSKESRPHKIQTNVIVTIIISVVFIAGAVTAALLYPKNLTSTDYVEQQYIFNEKNDETPDDGFGKVDWYSFYDTNPLSFEKIKYNDRAYYYQIHGLKSTEIENKINDAIKSHALALAEKYPGSSPRAVITANLYNILSVKIYNLENSTVEGLNFDLNTGNEISFDDIFTSKANKFSIVYDAVVRKLQVDLDHNLNGICGVKNKIKSLEEYGEAALGAMCFTGDETLEGLVAKRDEMEEELRRVDDTAIAITRDYLAQDSPVFYLYSCGPVFYYDGGIYEEKAKNIMDQLAYLERFRSSDSIYSDNSLSVKDIPLSDYYAGGISTSQYYHDIDFSDNVWVEYGGLFSEGIEPSNTVRYIKEHYSHDNPDPDHMRIVSFYFDDYDYGQKSYTTRTIDISDCSMPKSYFYNTYRETMFDSVSMYTGLMGMQIGFLGVAGYKGESNVTCSREDKNFFIDKDGKIYENPEDLFDPATEYIDYFKNTFKWFGYYIHDEHDVITYVPSSQLVYMDLSSYDLSITQPQYATTNLELKLTSPDGQVYSRTMSLSDVPYDYLKPSLR